MKAYTDLEQSKKLAEILPLESADMCYNDGELRIGYAPLARERDDYLPCWSLAALMNVLPRIDIEKELWSSDKYDYRVKAYIDDGYVGDWFNNPIDACYEIILMLYELNLL